MKKFWLFLIIFVGLVFGFSFAQIPSSFLYQEKKIPEKLVKRELRAESSLNKKNKDNTVGEFSGSQLSGWFLNVKRWSLFFWEKKQKEALICITWDKLVIRNSLSQKSLEASKKLFSLVEVSTKIGYNTKKITALAEKLQNLSIQIAKDCSPLEFQKHRQQIKEALDSLKTELQLFKQYVRHLSNR